MRPTELKTLLAASFGSGLSILIKGAPGVGKSNIVEQAAADAGAEVILSHPAVADPTDAKGLPWKAEGLNEATFLPFGELAQAMKAKKPTVWFLDDLGQAPPAVQASFMQLLLARRVNGHVLPDVVTFVAATNRRTDRAGVSGILEPVKSRFTSIVELEAHLDDWCQWAFGHGIRSELIAFLRFRDDLLSSFKPTADLTNGPCPRTWEHASRILDLNLPPKIQFDALAGAVGEGAAAELTGFLKMYAEISRFSVDAILTDPKGAELPTEPSTLYAVSTALGLKVSKQNFGRIATYSERLNDAGSGEFGALIIRDCLRKEPGITATADYARMCSGPLGHLISGVTDD